MKSGAVQNSPKDKSLPEPGPWSPVQFCFLLKIRNAVQCYLFFFFGCQSWNNWSNMIALVLVMKLPKWNESMRLVSLVKYSNMSSASLIDGCLLHKKVSWRMDFLLLIWSIKSKSMVNKAWCNWAQS